MWLRQRGSILELKYPMAADVSDRSGLSGIDFYNESTDLELILEMIKIPLSTGGIPAISTEQSDYNDTQQWVASLGLTVFSRFRTRRSRQSIVLHSLPSGSATVNIDIDEVDFLAPISTESDPDAQLISHAPYALGEIELVAFSPGCDPSVVMREVFTHLELSESRVRGKVLEYLCRYCPDQYKALTECGVIPSTNPT